MESSDTSDSSDTSEEEVANAERLKGSMAVEAFSCAVCAQLLSLPIFQCSSGSGHFICSSCCDKQPDKNKCPCCSGCALERSLGMERIARSILVDCSYAEHGCTKKTTYYEQDSHEKVCVHAPPYRCPEPGCGFAAGKSEQLLDHLTGRHGWPSTKFDYFKAFDLHVDKPGAQVLCCEEDGQLFLVNVKATAQPPGRAVSLVGVPPYLKPTGFGCRVKYSSFYSHRGTTALDDIQPLWLSDWPPTTEFLCFLPQVSDEVSESDEENEASVVPTISIMFVCDDTKGESDDTYIESDEDDSDYS